MRYRVIVETDFAGDKATFKQIIQSSFQLGELGKAIPGDIVLLATDEPGHTEAVFQRITGRNKAGG